MPMNDWIARTTFIVPLALAAGVLAAQAAPAPPGVTLVDRCEVSPGNPGSPPGGWDRNRKTGRVILTMQGTAPAGAKLRFVAANGAPTIVPFVSGADTPGFNYPIKVTLLSAASKPLKARLNGKLYAPAKGYHIRLAFTVDEMNAAKCRTLIAPPDPREFPWGVGKVRPSMRPYYGVDEFGKPMVE
jgi:hypothetical protein